MHIPNDLIDYLATGDAVIFVGNDLAKYAGLSSMSALALELSTRAEVDQQNDFYKAASYAIVKENSRVAVLNLLRERLDERRSNNGKIYEAIAKLSSNVFITTAYDRLLENAFGKLNKRLNCIITEANIPFWSEDCPQLIELLGNPWQPDSTVLTERERTQFCRTHPEISQKVRELFLVKSFLFIGCDPNSSDFQFVTNEMMPDAQDLRKKAYIVVANISDLQEKLISEQGFQVINLHADTDQYPRLLIEFLAQVADISKQKPGVYTNQHDVPPIVKFSNQIEELLNVMDSRVVERQFINRRCMELICISDRLLTSEKTIVRCIEGEINSSDVQDLGGRLASNEAGILISQTRIAPSARHALTNWCNIQLFTYAEFYRRLIDATSYIKKIIEEFEKDQISTYYVDLACEKRDYDLAGAEIDRDVYDPIQDYIDLWIKEQGRNHISILGNFGSGKTWFCRFYTYLQAKRYLQDPDNQRIPILIRLRDYSKATSMEHLMTDLLVNKCGIKLEGGYKAFDQLNADGKALIILDGFDEMERRVDYRVTVENFERLASIIHPKTKVILTCRTPYFRTNLQMREIFTSPDDVYIDLLSRPNFETIHLLDFNYEKIRQALRKRLPDTWESVYFQIQSVYDLPGLARRPALLDMISQSIPYLPKDQPIDQATLYQAYTGQWINKNIQEERTLLNAERKRYFMREVAWEMYTQEKLTLHFSEIPGRVQEYLGIIYPKDIDIFEHDIRTQSFLQRDEAGYYRFAHKSFVEYFIADRLSEELLAENLQPFTERILSFEVRAFLRYILKERAEKILSIVADCKGKAFEDIGFLASNLVSLLVTMGVSIRQVDFSNTCLRLADFSGADLSEAIMKGVDAQGANFRGVDFRRADFSYCNMKSSLVGENGVIRTVAFHPSGDYVACGGSDQNIRVFDTLLGSEVKKIPVFASIRTLLFSRDGEVIVTGGADKVVRGWNWEGGSQSFSLDGHQYNILCLAIDHNGQLIASADHNSEVRVWHVYSQEQYRKFTPNKGFDQCYMRSLAFANDGLLLGGDSRGVIHGWNVKENQEIFSHEAHPNHVVYGIVLSPDQKLVISCSDDRSLRIWDRSSWQLVATQNEFSDTILGVAIDQTGNYIATGCRSGDISIWETTTLKKIASFFQGAPILTIAYSPDGERIVTGAGDGTTKVWDLKLGKPIWEFCLPRDTFSCQDMKITGVMGWPPEWLRFMIEMGARE